MKTPEPLQAISASLTPLVGLIYLLVVSILLIGLLLISFRIVWHARTFQGLVRRATGMALPFVLLVFFFADATTGASVLAQVLDTTPERRFGLGVVTGIGVIEFSRLLIKLGSDAGPALAAFFFSFLDMFMMHSVVASGMQALHLFLLGIILSAGLDIMFIGFPDERPPPRLPPRDPPHVLTARDPD